MNYFIQKTLQLKDLNITINTEKVDEVIIKGQLSLVYYGKLSYTPKTCEGCGILNSQFQVIKNGYRQASRITLNTISVMPAFYNSKNNGIIVRNVVKALPLNSR